ncbi:hypothetical protein OsI_12100 [Oryza sativa Indica Group]|uniref:Uncharacterized protein n=1 Tax=Oryza sativa subsp. indica TaxID=39946 RepID=B8AK46_ORYSI|nr:hypothetical protein OsI_12100 [Oryza sativa Indica Group]
MWRDGANPSSQTAAPGRVERKNGEILMDSIGSAAGTTGLSPGVGTGTGTLSPGGGIGTGTNGTGMGSALSPPGTSNFDGAAAAAGLLPRAEPAIFFTVLLLSFLALP